MRKIQITATFWTMVLAVPFTALALSLAAYTTEHFGEILGWFVRISEVSTVGARGWLMEFSARWPEVAGMIVGQLVIMTILIFARKNQAIENHSN